MKNLAHVVALTLVLLVGLVSQGAETLKNSNLPPDVTALLPPTNQIDRKSGDEIFVILAREQKSDGGDWDHLATAWEYNPKLGTNGLVKRCEFVDSSWSPNLLFWEQPDLTPGLIRLQVDDPKNQPNYRVNLYAINYRDWSVETIFQSDQAFGIGVADSVVYLQVDGTVKRLNKVTWKEEPLIREFQVVRSFDTSSPWIVRFDSDSQTTFSAIDPTTQKIISSFDVSPDFASDPWCVNMKLSSNGRYLAMAGVHCERAVKDLFRQIENREDADSFVFPIEIPFCLVDLETGEVNKLPLTIFCSPGSGRPLIPTHFDFWFEADNSLRFISVEGMELVRVVPPDSSIEDYLRGMQYAPVSGTTTTDEVDIAALKQRFERTPEILVPAYFDLPDGSRMEERELAIAFLRYKDVEVDDPKAWGDSVTHWSEDKKRFLFKKHRGTGSGAFYFGDLDQRSLVRIHCPSAELAEANDINIYSIQIP